MLDLDSVLEWLPVRGARSLGVALGLVIGIAPLTAHASPCKEATREAQSVADSRARQLEDEFSGERLDALIKATLAALDRSAACSDAQRLRLNFLAGILLYVVELVDANADQLVDEERGRVLSSLDRLIAARRSIAGSDDSERVPAALRERVLAAHDELTALRARLQGSKPAEQTGALPDPPEPEAEPEAPASEPPPVQDSSDANSSDELRVGHADEPPAARLRPLRAAWIGALAGGLAITGAAVGFAVWTRDVERDYEIMGCTQATCSDLRATGKKLEITNITLFATGGTFLTAVGVMLLVDLLGARRRARSHAAHLYPLAGPGTAGLGGVVRF